MYSALGEARHDENAEEVHMRVYQEPIEYIRGFNEEAVMNSVLPQIWPTLANGIRVTGFMGMTGQSHEPEGFCLKASK